MSQVGIPIEQQLRGFAYFLTRSEGVTWRESSPKLTIGEKVGMVEGTLFNCS